MFGKVLIPVDVTVSQDARKLLDKARQLAAPWQSELHVVTVVPSAGMAIVGSYMTEDFEKQSIEAARAELATQVADAGLEAELHVLAGTVYDRVIALAGTLDVDLILIGAHRPELKDYLLGSNAARVVRHCNQSVMVLRD